MKKKNQFNLGSNCSLNHLRIEFHSIIFFGLMILLSTASACSTVRLQLNQFSEDKRAKLPQNIVSSDEDADIAKESSCIISVNDDSGVFFFGNEQVSEAQLTAKIVEKMKGKSPDKRIVYIESAVSVQYQTVVKLLNSIRNADVDSVGLVVFESNIDRAGTRPNRIEVKLPSEIINEIFIHPSKPNPLTLVVSIDKNGSLVLNNEPNGTVSDPKKLTERLSSVFKERENSGVFRVGTNEIEKTTFIKASLGLSYGDFIQVVDAVKIAGAQPIGLQLDDLKD